MRHGMSRRSFLKTAGTVSAGLSLGGLLGSCSRPPDKAAPFTTPMEKLGWRLAGQLYTFRSYSFYEAIEMIDSLGVKLLEPCFFLGLDKDRPELKTSESLAADARQKLLERLGERDMRMVNFYTNLKGDATADRKIFDFAKQMGVRTLVAEPPAEAFDAIESLCDEYMIDLAVHNHPKGENSKYWQPEMVLKACEGRGKRIGACCDTGHWVRSGLDPVECLKKMEGRIVSLHVKDVAEWGKPAARDVPLGTGKANYRAVLEELRRQAFTGVMAIEYEHQSPELLQEVAACIRFVEETAKTLV